jgi:predicted N-acetyltransferase YhbS
VIIRPETAADHDAIRKVNDEAFGDPIETKLVDAIRASDRFLSELSLVAVSEADPDYYERFGFTRADVLGIEPPPEARLAVLHGSAAREV